MGLKICLMAVLLFVSAPLVAVSSSAGGVDVYRIKVILSSDSDWTSVVLSSGVRIVNARYAVVSGVADGLDVAWESGWFGMSRCCYPEHVINATVEFEVLFAHLPMGMDVSFSVMKGDVGTTRVMVYNGLGELVKEITHTGVIPGSGGRNPLNFTISSARLARSGPVSTLGEGRFGRMVWAAYYPWYTVSSWREPSMADKPLIGMYSSDDPSVVRLHIKLAKAAGIDGFAVSWWGPGTNTDRNLRKVLEIAAEEEMYVAAYFESLTGDGQSRPLLEIENMLNNLITSYGKHPAYYKVDGKPLIFVWAAWSHEADEWRMVFENLRKRGLDAFYVATALNTKYLEAFDGLQNYGTGNLTELKRIYERVGPEVKTFHILHRGGERLWVPSISPGYDERLLPGRSGLYFDRDDGRYYLASYEHAVASYPDWVWITSFNEWWENTHIEPSMRYGYRYLFLTEQLTSSFKNRPSNTDMLLEQIIELEKQVVTFTATHTLLQTTTRQVTQTITVERTTTVSSLSTVVETRNVSYEVEVTKPETIMMVSVPLIVAAVALTSYLTRTRARRM